MCVRCRRQWTEQSQISIHPGDGRLLHQPSCWRVTVECEHHTDNEEADPENIPSVGNPWITSATFTIDKLGAAVHVGGCDGCSSPVSSIWCVSDFHISSFTTNHLWNAIRIFSFLAIFPFSTPYCTPISPYIAPQSAAFVFCVSLTNHSVIPMSSELFYLYSKVGTNKPRLITGHDQAILCASLRVMQKPPIINSFGLRGDGEGKKILHRIHCFIRPCKNVEALSPLDRKLNEGKFTGRIYKQYVK